MPKARIFVTALAGLVIIGCAATPPPADQPGHRTQDIEFMRGCWVQKDEPGGKILGFLRVLPKDQDTYLGQMSRVDHDSMKPVLEFILARDGSYVEAPYKGATLRLNAEHVLPAARAGEARFQAWLSDQYEPQVFHAGGDAETLFIYSGGHIFNITRYERDGCD